jgi:hypothetical protein
LAVHQEAVASEEDLAEALAEEDSPVEVPAEAGNSLLYIIKKAPNWGFFILFFSDININWNS